MYLAVCGHLRASKVYIGQIEIAGFGAEPGNDGNRLKPSFKITFDVKLNVNDLEQVKNYEYLWDGSQPGWVLNRLYGHYVDLSLKFNHTGPSNGELMAMRRAVSEYKSLPLKEVIAQLRNRQSVLLGRFMSDQARTIVATCRDGGLAVVEEVINAPRYVPTNEITGTVLLIEDDVLAKKVFPSQFSTASLCVM